MVHSRVQAHPNRLRSAIISGIITITAKLSPPIFHLLDTALFAIWAMHTTPLSSPIPKVTYSARRNIAMLPVSDGSTWPGLYPTRPMPNHAPRQL